MMRVTVLFWGLICCVYSPAQTFTDIAADFEIDALVQNNFFGSGMSFYDFNQDGWDDLSFTQTNAPCKFYLNNEGTFNEIPSFIYGDGKTKHLLWVDYDNDGDKDIFLTADGSPYYLYRNIGNLNFTDFSETAGLAATNERSYGAAFGDYDRDGFLDLYICTYEYLQDGEVNEYNKLNHLYHNNGDGTFTDVTEIAGVGNGIQASFGSVWIDYNKDSWPDLYVINDKIYPNTLYRNNGDGTFTDVSIATSSNVVIDAMTATAGDFNNDTHTDIYMTNTPGGNRLLKNNGNDTFSDISEIAGDVLDAYSWGAVWIDYDNNGMNDLYVSTYNPLLPDQANHFYINNGNETFTEFPDPFEGDHIADSMCPTKGDINNDGYSDLAVHNKAPYTPFLWLNSATGNNYIKITLSGNVSNKDGIGSWVQVYCEENIYSHYTLCGENYIGQSSQHLSFGVGESTVIDSVKVTWLSNIVDVFYDVSVNQSLTISEGETITASIEHESELPQFCFGDSLILSTGQWDSYLWSTGDSSQTISVEEPGDYYVTVTHHGLEIMSDTISVTVNPPLALDLDVHNVSCHNFSDGEIFITNNNGNDIESVVWSHDSLATNPASGLTSGSYLYEVTDSNGCSTTGTVQVQQPAELALELEVTHQYGELNGAAEISEISGGVPPYSLLWSEGTTDELEIDNLVAGEYSVTVTDSLQCSTQEFFLIDFHTSIPGNFPDSFNFYPIPVDDEMTIVAPEGVYDLNIFNILGELVYHDLISIINREKFFLKMKLLPKGLYVLRLRNKQFSISKKFSKN